MKIIIQAGHEGRTTGATGAPGEQAFNKDVSNRVADKLRARGVEVRRVNADPTKAEIAGDWDLFLSIHYDADVYKVGGGFVDYPEPSTDGATEKSQAIARTLAEIYFQVTGIKNVPSRSNKNTRYYYMWKSISAKTPCVIIECGVGQHKPDDYEVLQNQREKVVQGITNGVLKALGMEEDVADTYILPSGEKINLADRASNIVTAKTWDEVVHLKVWERKTDADERVQKARNEEIVKGEQNMKRREEEIGNSFADALRVNRGQSIEAYVELVKILVNQSNQPQPPNGSDPNTLPISYNGKEVLGVIIKP
jgi:N-acetylmuramoyl-L-alanine amidase